MAGRRRAVVTGLGVITSIGCDVPTFWRGCLEARSAVGPIPPLWTRSSPKSRYWAPLSTPIPEPQLLTRIECKAFDRSARLALAATEQALAMSGLSPALVDQRRNAYRIDGIDPERVGVRFGAAIGGLTSCLANASVHMLEEPKRQLAATAAQLRQSPAGVAAAEQIDAVLASLPTPARFSPFGASLTMPNSVSALLSIKFGLHGASSVSCSACAAGTVAIGEALRAIRDGECDLVLAGGAEYMNDVHGGAFRAFDVAGALVRDEGPPGEVNRPYDARRSGFLFAEGGAAALVVEEREHARARGAPVLAEVCGYGETGDGHSIMAMAPDGVQVRRAIELCLADVGLQAGDVHYVNGHGTGTRSNDEIECRVITDLFGAGPWVNSTKSLLGHTLGAAGAIEAVVTVLSLRDGVVHPCRNLVDPVGDARFARCAQPAPLRHALSQSFAFGGQNAVLAFRTASDR